MKKTLTKAVVFVPDLLFFNLLFIKKIYLSVGLEFKHKYN